MSNRQKDYLIEKITNEFEDRYFWSKILGNNLSCLVRYSDRQHQFAGIDFTLKGICFDEKVKYYGCLNEVQECPGFEVSQLNSIGQIQDGWLVADGISTEWYSIVGLSATTWNEAYLSSFEQLRAIDILWVQKKQLIDYIESYTPMKQLIADAKTLRAGADERERNDFYMHWPVPNDGRDEKGMYRTRYDHNKFWLTYSSRMKEQPMNLVIPRKTLESFSHTRHFVVDTTSVKSR